MNYFYSSLFLLENFYEIFIYLYLDINNFFLAFFFLFSYFKNFIYKIYSSYISHFAHAELLLIMLSGF